MPLIADKNLLKINQEVDDEMKKIEIRQARLQQIFGERQGLQKIKKEIGDTISDLSLKQATDSQNDLKLAIRLRRYRKLYERLSQNYQSCKQTQREANDFDLEATN